jgi:hypothetical protein
VFLHFVKTQMQELMRINRDALFAKLNALGDKHRMPCAAFIEACSNKPATDQRIISDYPRDMVILYERRRHFTLAGLIRFTQDGHLINYKNVCDWLGIVPDEHLIYKKELKKMMRDGLYIKQSLVKFLFGTRRAVQAPAVCTLAEFLDALTPQLLAEAPADKLAFLHSIK